MASILIAYHDGEWKSERFQSLGDARRVAYLGEQRGILTPIQIDMEKYYKGRTEIRTNWNRADDGPFTEWWEESCSRHRNPPEYVTRSNGGEDS